jgi:UDP-N-acetylmuramoyl-tripeptide--D-alanyl-D-alanine ligase
MISFNDILKINYTEIRNFDRKKKELADSVSIDTRTLKKGAIYFAIRGDKIDGHLFIKDAVSKRASAVVVDSKFIESVKWKSENFYDMLHMPVVVVEDTILALGELANVYRKKFNIPVIAVAGSNGKTTTKDMVTNVLAMKYKVLATDGNLNNQIGVPLTIFRLTNEDDIAVIEIGTNHFGEIKYLCGILDPTHGIITNIGNEHLEFLKNIEGVKKEEGDLFRYLSKNDGKRFAFVNANDKIILELAAKLKHKVEYGVGKRYSDVCILNEKSNGFGKYKFDICSKTYKSQFSVDMNVSGRHNMLNALVAATVGLFFKVPPKKIKKSLASFKPSSKRMEVITEQGISVINDTYNANLESMLFALETVVGFKTSGKRIIVLADMLELGKVSQKHHTLVGKAINKFLAEGKCSLVLLTYGKMAKFIHGTVRKIDKYHFKDKKLLRNKLENIVATDDVILIKGSRGMKMEEVVESLLKKLRG